MMLLCFTLEKFSSGTEQVKNEEEMKNLQKRLEELLQQAQSLGLTLDNQEI